MSHFLADKDCRWKGGRVPYGYGKGLSDARRRAVRNAMDIWELIAPVRFVPRRKNKDDDWVRVSQSSNDCSSDVGRCGGEQHLRCNLLDSAGNGRTRSIMHELGHTLGLKHEHQRPNRNDVIRVRKSNLADNEFADTNISRIKSETRHGPHDVDSIMHYSSLVPRASRNPNQNLIDRRNGPRQIVRTQASRPSLGDIAGLEAMYGREAGDLTWTQHLGTRTGAVNWTRSFARQVGSGWQRFSIVAGTQTSRNVIYAVDRNNGDLVWYRHDGARNGPPINENEPAAGFAAASGTTVGTGWQRFSRVVASNSGVIYAIDRNTGNLHWYRHLDAATGGSTWHEDSGKVIGTGWQRFTDLTCGGQGVLYARERNGELKWYQHRGFRDGATIWHSNSESLIGTGWQRFREIVASGSAIYATEPDGDLFWYRHRGFGSGSNSWANGSGSRVGTGWQIYNQLVCVGNGRLYGIVGR